MNRNLRRGLILLATVLAVAGAGWWFARPEPVPAQLVAVSSGVLEALVANTRGGTLNACRRAQLAPASGGTIAALTVSAGDRVKAGDVLLSLWSADLAAQVTLAESEARAAAANGEQACLRADAARRESARLEKLRSRELVSEERLDQAMSEANALDAACAAARAGGEVAVNRVSVARAALERSQVRAPFDGIVAEVNGEVGEFVTPSPPGISMPPAIDLIDTGCLYVSAPIDEVDAPLIRAGLAAHVSFDALPGQRFPGRVRRVAPYIRDLEKQARTVEIEVALQGDAMAGLLPGYTADVEVVIERREGVLRVPVEALLDGDTVLLFEPVTRRLVRRALEIGLRNWQLAEVRGGLVAGDRIALAPGRDGVVEGAVVTPLAEHGAAQ